MRFVNQVNQATQSQAPRNLELDIFPNPKRMMTMSTINKYLKNSQLGSGKGIKDLLIFLVFSLDWNCAFLMIQGPWNKAEPFWLLQPSEIVKICQFQGPQ